MVPEGRDVEGYVRLLVVIYDRIDRRGAAAAPGRSRAAVDLRPQTFVGGRWLDVGSARLPSSSSSAATSDDVRPAVRTNDTADSTLGTRGTRRER